MSLPLHASSTQASMLLSALRLPLSSRRIASWIFDERDTRFRTNTTLISPDFLKKAVYVSNRSEFALSDNTTEHIDDQPEAKSEQTSISPLPACLFMSLIPVEVIDGAVLGYAFCVGTAFDPVLLDLRSTLNSTFGQVARFAFDGIRKHLLVYTPSYTVDRDMLAVMDWISDKDRQVHHISFLSRQYSFDNLPSEILSVTALQEQNVLEPLQRPRLQSPLVITDLFANTSERTDKVNPTTSGNLWDTADTASVHPHLFDDFGVYREASPAGGEFSAKEASAPGSSTSLALQYDSIDSGQAIPTFSRHPNRSLPECGTDNSKKQSSCPSDSESFDISPIGLWVEQIKETITGHFQGTVETVTCDQITRFSNFQQHCTIANAEEQQMLSVFSSRTYSAETGGRTGQG